MALAERCNYNCRLAKLAELMEESTWQREELARIKTKFGYRMCNLLYRGVDKMFFGNMFSYIDKKFQQSMEDSGEKPNRELRESPDSLERPERSRLTTSTDCREVLTLEQMNARTFGRERKSTKITFLSRLLLAYSCCCSLGLLMTTFYQYRYDYYFVHLTRFRSGRTDDRPTIYEKANVTEEQLLMKIQEAKKGAKFYGSFLLNRSFFAQSCYILMTILCILIYQGPIIVFHLKGSFDFHYLRMLLDWDLEQRNCNRMIVDWIEKLCHSSKRFGEVLLGEHQSGALGFSLGEENNAIVKLCDGRRKIQATDGKLAGRSMSLSSSGVGAMRPSRDQVPNVSSNPSYGDEHRWMQRRLKVMALTGRLQPLDRCSLREISNATTIYATFSIISVLSCFTWNIILFSTLPHYFDFIYELDFMDCVSFIELASLNVLITLSGMYYISTALVYCREQARIAHKLRSIISGFIAKHRRLMWLADSTTIQNYSWRTSTLKDYYEVLNTELLLILMHYKIFASQSRPAQRSFGLVLISATGLMTIFPIITRLHLPYYHDMGARVLSVIVCLIMIGIPDIAIVPMCWMHSRCLDLCQDMWKLMAVVVDIAQHPNLGAMLNEHSVWLLRKELSFPEKQHGQFAIVTLGLKFTYTELLKLHFWIGFVILPLIVELRSWSADSSPSSVSSQSDGESIMLLGSLSDPLGIISTFSL